MLAVLAGVAIYLLRSGPAAPPAGDGNTSPFLRLTVEVDFDGNSVGIAEHGLVYLPRAPRPAWGPYLAVLDGPDGAQAVVPVSATRTLVQELHTPTGVERTETVLSRSATAVFLPFSKSAVSVRIFDRQGAVRATLDSQTVRQLVSTLPRWDTMARRLVDVVLPPVQAAGPLEELAAAFPHIRFVTERSQFANEGTKAKSVRVRTAEPEVAARLLQAMKFISHELAGSVATIGVADFNAADMYINQRSDGSCSMTSTRGLTIGNELVLNAQDLDFSTCLPTTVGWERLTSTLAHEATHAFTNLSDHIDQFTQGAWFLESDRLPGDVVTLARTVQDGLGGRAGAVSASFGQLQESAVSFNHRFLPYASSNGQLGAADSVAAGFASGYGGINVREDLAEYVQVFFNPAMSEFINPVCTQFAGLTGTIPSRSLLAFAKVNFLRAIHLISENHYGACVQNADPATAAGFDVDVTWSKTSFGNNLKVGMTNPDAPEPSRFLLVGQSGQSQAMLQILALPPYNSVLGFHKLDSSLGWATPYLPDKKFVHRNQFTVHPLTYSSNSDLTKRTRVSTGGYVLITNNLPEDTKGYMFYVSMDDWMANERARLELSWFWVK